MANNVMFSSIYLGNHSTIGELDPNESGNSDPENIHLLYKTFGGAGAPLSGQVHSIDSDTSGSWFSTDRYDPPEGTFTYNLGSGSRTSQLDTLVLVKADVTLSDGTVIKDYTNYVGQMVNGDTFMLNHASQSQLPAGAKIVSATFKSLVSSADTGSQAQFASQVFQACLLPGTLIDVPGGQCVIEDLMIGDLVETANGEPMPVRWIGRWDYDLHDAEARHKPVEIKPGSLGDGVPRDVLRLSRQHRLSLVLNGSQQLIPAGAFVGQTGIRLMRGIRRVTYLTLMLDQHAVIRAAGCPVESFYPGPIGLRALTPWQRNEIDFEFPGLLPSQGLTYGPPVHPVMGLGEARRAMRGRKVTAAA